MDVLRHRRFLGGIIAGLGLAVTVACGSETCPERASCPAEELAGDAGAGTGTDGKEPVSSGSSGASSSGSSGSGGSSGSSGSTGSGGSSGSGGSDASTGDASTGDASAGDAGSVDASTDAGGPVVVNPGGCVSGAVGTHVARFRWSGNGSGSTAHVQYEKNNLPDTSRWKAGAFSRGAIGSYKPTFEDVFLGAGGLVFGGTVFMDVELSTAGLGSIQKVTLALLGRSYSTTGSSSFSWLTFDGAGATPSGFVSNVAPYVWYRADATAAFKPGNAAVLLRIEAPSAIVVNRVELCFQAK